ncbi:hypothetical protein [Chitinophaga sedimenti]|nr:hypothetical protein [Chitinophaga sedimenti]
MKHDRYPEQAERGKYTGIDGRRFAQERLFLRQRKRDPISSP